MNYTRSQQEGQLKHRYEQFCRANHDLIAIANIPSFVLDDHQAFIYLIMHGDLWPQAPIRYDVLRLPAAQYEAWKLLVQAYLARGFAATGLNCLRTEDYHV